ncbi:MAG: TlpA family protein disulfide reductase [Ktedonobacteraceae bacterium]
MSDIIVRIGVLAFVSLLACAIVWYGRRFVEKRRQVAFAALPLESLPGMSGTDTYVAQTPVRILAFSSVDCHQCHTLQTPALQRVTEARKYQVSVEEIDAPGSPELTQRYQVLTVPTTVVLDAAGHVHAVNYGFANTQRLLEQVDGILSAVAS